HQDGLWGALRKMIFADGRLLRLGGDSRVRYAYCQEYILPTLLYAADCFADAHAEELVDRTLEMIEKEAAFNGNGSLMGSRLEMLRGENAYYSPRLESDRAATIASIVAYRDLVNWPKPADESFQQSVAGGWIEPEHKSVMH